MFKEVHCVTWRHALFRFALLVCVGAVPGATVYADVLEWDFSGFGTLAGVKTDEDIAKYRLDLRQGEGASSDIDWGLHSKLGVQAAADFGESFSLTAQAVAQRRGQDDMDPELEWLYASYRPASWFDIRAGRLVMPELMASDYRSVGYAQPTATPPALVYIWASVSSFEGAQLYNRIPLGEGLLSIQTSVGESDEVFWFSSAPVTVPTPFGPLTVPPDLDIRVRNLRAVNVAYEWSDWLVRAVNLEHDLSFPDSLFGPGEFEQTFKGLGVQYDNGRLLVMAEHVDRSDAATAQYVLLGWRFDKWLPSATFAESDVTDPITLQDVSYDSTSFALRYDISRSMAVKLQWEETPAANTSLWLDVYPGFGGDREVISFSLDFVF
jgi:hypothetical protein